MIHPDYIEYQLGHRPSLFGIRFQESGTVADHCCNLIAGSLATRDLAMGANQDYHCVAGLLCLTLIGEFFYLQI